MKDAIDINIDSLDTEWLKQPRMYLEAAEEATAAGFKHDRAKDQLEDVKAELDFKIRANHELFGLTKSTEASIAGAILLQGSYEEALEAYQISKRDYNSAMNVVKALDHRKKALENLVQLYIGQYFSSPRETLHKTEGKGIQDIANTNTANKVRSGIKRKKV